MTQDNEITIETGSTSVYSDLGYADAGAMQRKSQLAGEIARAIKPPLPVRGRRAIGD